MKDKLELAFKAFIVTLALTVLYFLFINPWLNKQEKKEVAKVKPNVTYVETPKVEEPSVDNSLIVEEPKISVEVENEVIQEPEVEPEPVVEPEVKEEVAETLNIISRSSTVNGWCTVWTNYQEADRLYREEGYCFVRMDGKEYVMQKYVGGWTVQPTNNIQPRRRGLFRRR